MIKIKNLSFEAILKGCKKNKNNCKELLYKLFYGYLIAIIFRYTKNLADSEELVNDAFIKIFKNIGSFHPKENSKSAEIAFKSWIAQIASRTAIDKIRSYKLIHRIDDLHEADHPVSPVSASTDLEVEDILKLLNHLPETHRLIFNLYEIEGFSHEEIAKMIDISVSSSRVYLTRAKNKLRFLYKISQANSLQANG